MMLEEEKEKEVEEEEVDRWWPSAGDYSPIRVN